VERATREAEKDRRAFLAQYDRMLYKDKLPSDIIAMLFHAGFLELFKFPTKFEVLSKKVHHLLQAKVIFRFKI